MYADLSRLFNLLTPVSKNSLNQIIMFYFRNYPDAISP
jgi:hypothetical protein